MDLGPSVEKVTHSKTVPKFKEQTSVTTIDSSNEAIKLYYWPNKGLAERVRLLLEFLNLKYENKTFESEEEWETQLNDENDNLHPFLNLPFIKDGDTLITQSDAIIVYLILKANKP